MRVTLTRNDGEITVTSSEKTSLDVLAMIGASDLVKARMRHASRATFQVEVRSFACGCQKLQIPCRCKKSASIVEVGDRLE
jgi:hypothetical protein